MNTILISVIIPTYKAESFIANTIETVQKQTLKDIEIILVDDGSPDKTGEICDSYAANDSRIQVIHKVNGGQSSARNAGIKAARGEYIGFMDHDDIVEPNWCEVLYQNAKEHNADISGVSYITQDEKGVITHNQQTNKVYVFDNRQGVKEYLSRQLMDIYVWTKIYKKTFVEEHEIYFEEGKSDEDFLYNHKAFFNAQRSVYADTPLYLYMEYATSTCRTLYKKDIKKYLSDTLYRVNKVENEVAQNYPEFISLAKIQKIKAFFRLLYAISLNKKDDVAPYYLEIKKYLENNADFVIKERKHWGMTWFGTMLAAYMPPALYLAIKKYRH